MDYADVYHRFIVDRRSKEPALSSTSTYFEKHHIVPKSLGGSDDRDNLITLTPEDHFFAHLLLAKMYGGKMWVAVRTMRFGRAGGERPWVRGRYMYAIARRRTAEWMSTTFSGQPGKRGADNGMHDPTVYEWTNVDTGASRPSHQTGHAP